ncbi:MAG TPA: glycosyltransferase family 4 protein [Gammaproteobacteria bacterium]
MKIGLFHGYNLTGSGSNEFTRYLARTFLDQGHSVHIICREYHPAKIEFAGQLWQWKRDGGCAISVANKQYENTCTLHQIPYGDLYPVYISGKQRSDTFKEFIHLTDKELDDYKALNDRLLALILAQIKIDILHANHLVLQPSLALAHCKRNHIPLVIYPHGSEIEYAIKKDLRYQLEARKAIMGCQGLIIGNREVTNRLCNLFPDLSTMILEKTHIVGVGVDTRLFAPVARPSRPGRIKTFSTSRLIDDAQGKSPQDVQAMHEELDRHHYDAIATLSDAYVHNSVDRDIKDKLAAVDFSQPVIVFVGALTGGKGLQSLICALPGIYKVHPNTRLLVIGAGGFREVLEAFIYALARRDYLLLQHLLYSPLEPEQKQSAALWEDVVYYLDNLANPDEYFALAQRLLPQVVFLGRFNHEQLSHVFPCADLAVFPSVIPEAYPLVLMESLANGVLPVVSYFSGFKDGVDELQQYLPSDAVEPMKIPMDYTQRVEAIANNIVALLEMLNRKDLGGDLAKIAREQYDWSHRARQMTDAYQVVIERTQ